jgi:hypothetical protein
MEQAREALKKLNVFARMQPDCGANWPDSGGPRDTTASLARRRSRYKSVAFVSHPNVVG